MYVMCVWWRGGGGVCRVKIIVLSCFCVSVASSSSL